MSFITICGGGGKTTICNKYPNLFIDIDSFVWSDINKFYHLKLSKAIDNENLNEIGKIYKEIMLNNGNKINNKKIILGHNSECAEWLNRKCIGSIKPSKELHKRNIKNRSEKMRKIAINCWNQQKNAQIYYDYKELENFLLFLV